MIYACKKCNQVFNVKPTKHGRAKTPYHVMEYVACSGEIVEAEVIEVKNKKKTHYIFQFLA